MQHPLSRGLKACLLDCVSAWVQAQNAASERSPYAGAPELTLNIGVPSPSFKN